jgi:hypothetical protein
MILHNTTVSIDHAKANLFIEWFNVSGKVMLTKSDWVEDCRLLKLLNEDPNGGTTFAVQVYHVSMLEYSKYQMDDALKFDKDLDGRFAGYYAKFSTLLEVVV